MKIEPKDAPVINQVPQTKTDARAKAIAAYMNQTANQAAPDASQSHPVRNPTQVSPEEISAVKASTSTESVGQTDTVESTSEAVETKPEVTKAPKEDSLSSQYALLARKEKALRAKAQQQDAAAKAREAALVEREAKLAAKDSEYQARYIPKDRIVQDPLAALSELGVSYDQITQAILNSPKPENMEQLNAIRELKAELVAVKEAQLAAKKSIEDQQQQSYQQAISQIRKDATKLVENNPDYETIKETKQVNEIVKLIEKTYHEDGYVMDIEEAAQLVEQEIVDRIMATVNIKKIKQKLQPAEKPVNTTSQKTQETISRSEPQSQKTLTNAIGSSRPLSATERAVLAFQGKLQK